MQKLYNVLPRFFLLCSVVIIQIFSKTTILQSITVNPSPLATFCYFCHFHQGHHYSRGHFWPPIWIFATFCISPTLWRFYTICAISAIFAKVVIFAKIAILQVASNLNHQLSVDFRDFRNCMHFWTKVVNYSKQCCYILVRSTLPWLYLRLYQPTYLW